MIDKLRGDQEAGFSICRSSLGKIWRVNDGSGNSSRVGPSVSHCHQGGSSIAILTKVFPACRTRRLGPPLSDDWQFSKYHLLHKGAAVGPPDRLQDDARL